MAGTVTLVVKMGEPKGKRFTFDDRASLVLGRAGDCDLRVGSGGFDKLVSRHHCRIDVEPPRVWVRDLGSLNGTYVNGRMIGRPGSPDVGGRARQVSEAHVLEDGDEVWVGMTILGVEVNAPQERESPSLVTADSF